MTQLFFWLGTTGGFGILVLLAVTALAVIVFFARDPRGENTWRRLIAPALAAAALGRPRRPRRDALRHSARRPAGSAAAWALPASYAAVAITGLAWGLMLKMRRPRVYAAIGLGAARRHRPAHPRWPRDPRR